MQRTSCTHHASRHLREAGAALILAACGQAGLSHSASAAIDICRGDPHVMLGDGHQVDLAVSIGDSAADVQSVQYTVHIPVGASVRRIVYPASPLSGKEIVTTVADQPAHTYRADTVVTTGSSSAVEAVMHVPGVGRDGASGASGDDLSMQVEK